MTISMYQASVPVFLRGLNNLLGILAKAASHAEAQRIDPAALIHSRLYPDMFTFAQQIQVATDHAKGAAARLGGIEPPKYEDVEQTFSELEQRIRKTIDYLNGFEPEQIDGSEERTIELRMRGGPATFPGLAYLLHFALPNFFFHVTTAYDLMRHNGVELHKRDYLGRV